MQLILDKIESILKPINSSKWMRDIYWNFIPDETTIIYDFFDKLMVDFGVEVDVGTGYGSTFGPFANKGCVVNLPCTIIPQNNISLFITSENMM